MKIYIVTSVLLSSYIHIISGSLPSGLTSCNRSDVNFNKCLIKAVEDSFKTLKYGNIEFEIPVIDPFKVDYTESTTPGGNQNFYLKSSLNDTLVTGLTNIKVQRIAIKFNKSFGLRLEGSIERFSIIGNYKMDGKILVLPINGEGKCNVTMLDVIALAEARGKYFQKNNENFIELYSLSIKLNPTRVFYNFENIFKNDKKLSETINNFMNEEWKLVTENLIPGYETNFGEIFKEIANKIFTKVPTNEIFPN